jgi:hypothetical protein
MSSASKPYLSAIAITLITTPAIAAVIFWLSTINQPLIDQFAFRQTQTALTALFMQPGLGGILNYQTPVLGIPWAIPFEFPLFQWLAAFISRTLLINLSSCGRLLSIIFGIACIGPALGLLHIFGIRKAGKTCFLLLYFSSAIYLYWNRSFMIETTALFFSLLSLYVYSLIRIPAAQTDWRQYTILTIVFGLFITVGLLVKATTVLPSLLLVALDLGWQLVSSTSQHHCSMRSTVIRLLPIAIAALLALLLLKTWTHHADVLKTLNPFGSKLTSDALSGWNYGTIGQRFSADLWVGVLFERMLTPIGAIPTTLLTLAALRLNRPGGHRFCMLACIGLALIPLIIFSNLHIVHTYYQAANQIFLLLAISTAFDGFFQVWTSRWQQVCSIAAIILFMLGNYQQFSKIYLKSSTIQSSERLEIGKIIQQKTNPQAAIIVFGDDWSSEIAYHSQRRSLTMPPWSIAGINEDIALQHPDQFLGGSSLGAVITNQVPIDSKSLKRNCPCKEMISQNQWQIYICQEKTHLS